MNKGREKEKKYEERKKDHTSCFRAMNNDQLLEEVSIMLPGCSQDMCFACLGNNVLLNELRKRMEGK